MSAPSTSLSDAVSRVLAAGRRHGASDVEACAAEGETLEVGVRLGEIETLKRARERRIAVRVFVGQASAICSTADLAPEAIDRLAESAVALARATAPDPFAGLADPREAPVSAASLDLWDPTAGDITAEDALDLARRTEHTALAQDPRIDNSEGATFEAGSHRVVLATSRGVESDYRTSSFSLAVAPVARDGEAMQQDYWYSTARHRADLESPEEIGRVAAARVLRRLGARSVRTCEVPVVFEAPMAASLVGHVAAALAGTSVYRGLSFLRERLGEELFHPSVTLVDDPHLAARLGSRPVDGEGMATRRNVVVEAGRIRSYLLDTYSARKLGLEPTASAVRALGDAPVAGTSNFFLEPGTRSPEEIVAEVGHGFFVTELSGFGVNPVTGDYSRGASGLWIENGKPSFPVEGVTIAGNLLEMFRTIEAIGNDLRFRSRIASPTIRLARMTVAGD